MSAAPCARDPVTVLPGVTPSKAEALSRLGVATVEDLLRLAPRRHEDRRSPTPSTELVEGPAQLFIGTVRSSRAVRLRNRMGLLEAEFEDAQGVVRARWFYRGFVPRPLTTGRRVALYGSIKGTRQGARHFVSPEIESLLDADVAGPAIGRWVPIHPLVRGLTAPWLRRRIWDALPLAQQLEDPLPAALRGSLALPSLSSALGGLHFPKEEGDAEIGRARLAFDELLGHELALAERRARRRHQPGWPVPFGERVVERIRARLPFELTPGQEQAVGQIVSDLEAGQPMYRLLQGDVGSGKTAVAVYAMLGAVAAGLQAAFMAPTEVLVRQHAQTLERLLLHSRVRMEVRVGSGSASERQAALARIAAGEVDLVVGTHAVISEQVRFARLGLVIVDEQHKFGVQQRRDLAEKGHYGSRRPHCLVMTATPIPRTLAMAVYGDLDVSVIQGLPPGRQPVQTRVMRATQGREILKQVRAQLALGHQAYVVYPLVQESEKIDLRDAQAGQERWARALPEYVVGLVHGKMTRDAKAAAMEAFRDGSAHVLVATVVVEVGVDVPNATVLVVEHAERFGLSQLHQLRGRVGRGGDGGLCVLVDRSRKDSPRRLDVLARTNDGFEVAEEDLKMRGLGDLLGTRQHGRPHFVAARLPSDLPLLIQARKTAQAVLLQDPSLQEPAHQGLARLRQRSAGPPAPE